MQQWLATTETRLGSLSQRLSASVGKRQLNTDLAGDSSASQSTKAPSEQLVQTPWLAIDDVFYEARGFTWALIHLLKAVETDFGDVLDKKAARVSLRQIIRELEPTQQTLVEPYGFEWRWLWYCCKPLPHHGLAYLPNQCSHH